MSRIAAHSPYDYAPAWSPNGSLLAFTCYGPSWEVILPTIGMPPVSGDIPYDDRDAEICIVRSNGERIRLTNNRVPDYDPIWSPDGSKIAFVSRRGLGSDIYIMNSDGTDQTRLTRTGSASDVAWSPMGSQICYRSGNYLWLVDVDTGSEQRLTNNVEMEGYPVWSPNGRAVAFLALEKNDSDWGMSQAEVRLFALDTGEQKTLGMASPGWTFAWSPNGTHLAFVGPKRERKNTLYSIDTQTLAVAQLTWEEEHIEEVIAWAVDGQHVFYVTGEGVCTAKVDGSGWNLVTEISNVVTFVGVRNLVLSPNEDLIALMRAENPDISEIWVMDLEEEVIERASSGW